jgi:hypothetical protein
MAGRFFALRAEKIEASYLPTCGIAGRFSQILNWQTIYRVDSKVEVEIDYL